MLVMARFGRQWIVVATFADGDALDTEVFGPFTTPEVADRWCTGLEDWMTGSQRKVHHLLITKVQDPGFVNLGTGIEPGEPTRHTVTGKRGRR